MGRQITVRLSEWEYEVLQRTSRQTGTTRSEIIRRLLRYLPKIEQLESMKIVKENIVDILAVQDAELVLLREILECVLQARYATQYILYDMNSQEYEKRREKIKQQAKAVVSEFLSTLEVFK